jgi:hypothetical protein
VLGELATRENVGFEIFTAVTIRIRLLRCGALWVLSKKRCFGDPHYLRGRRNTRKLGKVQTVANRVDMRTRSSETSDFARPTRRHIPEDDILH